MNRIVQTRFVPLAALLIALLFSAIAAHAQTTQFTYQGRLTDGGSPANGSYDVQVKLFDALTSGNQIGATNSLNGVAVSSGVFTVTLDFGAGAFPGASRWAEISARPAGNGAFTTLTPRQPVTSTPYAIKSLSAGAADSLSVSCSGCVTGAQIGSLPANNGNYIQNGTTPQASSNFNISGNGIVGGRVGIGTSNPANKLHVLGGFQAMAQVESNFANSPDVGYRLIANSTQWDMMINRWTAGGNTFSIGNGAGASSNFLSILTNGNVGIGTNTPTTKFQVNGDKMSILSTQGSYGQLQIGNPNNGASDEATLTLNTGLTTFGNSPTAANSWGIGAGAFGLGGAKLAIGYGTPGANFGTKLTIQNNGNVGIGTNTPGSLLTLRASSNTAPALEVNQGAIKVTGAGIGSSTSVFVHVASTQTISAANCGSSQCTLIDHPLINGDPNAILIITPNWNPSLATGGVYNNHAVGVFFQPSTSKWAIFNQDLAAMPVSSAFNVLVVKP